MRVKTGVYKITNKVNGKFYIGSSASPRGVLKRWKDHRKTLRRGTHHNRYIQRAWAKYGESSFLFEIVEECLPEQCIEREQFYIDTLRPDYNLYLIAGSPLGRVVSEETKVKISNALSGRTLPDEHRQKIAASLVGNLRRLGTKNPNAPKGRDSGRFAGVYVFKNVETGETFSGGQFEFSSKFLLDASTISKVCNGVRKSHNHWICLEKTYES